MIEFSRLMYSVSYINSCFTSSAACEELDNIDDIRDIKADLKHIIAQILEKEVSYHILNELCSIMQFGKPLMELKNKLKKLQIDTGEFFNDEIINPNLQFYLMFSVLLNITRQIRESDHGNQFYDMPYLNNVSKLLVFLRECIGNNDNDINESLVELALILKIFIDNNLLHIAINFLSQTERACSYALDDWVITIALLQRFKACFALTNGLLGQEPLDFLRRIPDFKEQIYVAHLPSLRTTFLVVLNEIRIMLQDPIGVHIVFGFSALVIMGIGIIVALIIDICQ